MRLEETGAFEVAAPADAVLDYLADAEAVVGCLPGQVSRVEPREDGGVNCELHASHAGASATVQVRCYVTAVDAEAGRVRYSGHGLGSRVKVDVDGTFDLAATTDGTRVDWHGAAAVGGLMSSLNRGPAEVAVRQKLGETADNVRAALDAAAG